jgi:hypothetical protein
MAIAGLMCGVPPPKKYLLLSFLQAIISYFFTRLRPDIAHARSHNPQWYFFVRTNLDCKRLFPGCKTASIYLQPSASQVSKSLKIKAKSNEQQK